jgi:hypothetical protein
MYMQKMWQFIFEARFRLLLVAVLFLIVFLNINILSASAGLIVAGVLPGWWLLTRTPKSWELSQTTKFFLSISVKFDFANDARIRFFGGRKDFSK